MRIKKIHDVSLSIADGTDQYFRASTSTLAIGQWYHFTFVFDRDSSANSIFYVNGVAQSGTIPLRFEIATKSGNIQSYGYYKLL